MFNFTKKHGNNPAAESGEKYDAAIKEIERLEGELSQKTYALNQSCKAQSIMSESIKSCAASLYTTQNQLQAIAGHLDLANKHICELIQKNRLLKSSGDTWFNRAIKLEFEILTAKDNIKKIEHERDLAVKICELLQAELISAGELPRPKGQGF